MHQGTTGAELSEDWEGRVAEELRVEGTFARPEQEFDGKAESRHFEHQPYVTRLHRSKSHHGVRDHW